jgi:solute carrier family 36 (proton-coupled amino acid transporter)
VAIVQFRGTLTIGFSSITVIFLVFGAVGYSAYGEHTMDKITDNLPDDWSTTSVKVALVWALFFTFPIMMVPAYEILERALGYATWFDRNVAPGRRFECLPSDSLTWMCSTSC